MWDESIGESSDLSKEDRRPTFVSLDYDFASFSAGLSNGEG